VGKGDYTSLLHGIIGKLLFFYLCRPRTFTLAADDQIEDDEVELPRWVSIEQLRLEDIQSHGEIILVALQQKDPSD
jgi:hypothetical protein